MTSTLVLYFNSLIEKDKNFILDHWVSASARNPDAILNYLNTLQKETISNFQYVKHGLSISIKVDMNQTALNMGGGDNVKDLNYISIQNGSEKVYYYFIISKNWKSQNTIELVLSMDTLNTFMYDSDYVINKKTLIKRQHKDRFEKLSGNQMIEYTSSAIGIDVSSLFTDLKFAYSMPKNIVATILLGPIEISNVGTISRDGKIYIKVDYRTTGTGPVKIFVTYDVDSLVRKIDLKSEEINVPVYKTNEQLLTEKDKPLVDWSLYYKNSSNQENAPVDCFLVPSEAMELYYQTNAGELNSGNIPSGKYVIFFSTYPAGELTFKYGDSTFTIRKVNYIFARGYYAVAVRNNGGTIELYTGYFYYDTNANINIGSWTKVYTGNINVMNSPSTIYGYAVNSLPDEDDMVDILYQPIYATTSISMGSLTQSTLYGSNSIDKTLEENIKLINIPYSPTPYEIDSNNVYTFDACWTYSSVDGKLKLTDFTKRFSNEIETNYENLVREFFQTLYHNIDITTDASRTLIDPKILHSDFTRFKFVYDSFGKIFPLEQVSYDSSNKTDFNFKFEFVMSRNIVSKFLFKFEQLKYNHSTEDYDNILPVSRNNEEVLYSSQYLDYLRSGYNYDLKSKERQETASAIGIGLNVAGLLASIGLSFVPGGQAIGIGSAVASGLGLVGQIVNYAKTTAQNEENIQRKLQETQMQANSVKNADDYDLLYAYSSNKAKMIRYECSSRMQHILDDLFYYCGYVHNEQGKPSIHTRRSFNFVQASLEVDQTTNLTNEILDDIKEKFEQGVTFLHYSFNKYDFAQDKENIELSVL